MLLEKCRTVLKQKCEDSFDKLRDLEEIKQKLEIDLQDKTEALRIDIDQLELTERSTGLSHKPDPLKVINCFDFWFDLFCFVFIWQNGSFANCYWPIGVDRAINWSNKGLFWFVLIWFVLNCFDWLWVFFWFDLFWFDVDQLELTERS